MIKTLVFAGILAVQFAAVANVASANDPMPGCWPCGGDPPSFATIAYVANDPMPGCWPCDGDPPQSR